MSGKPISIDRLLTAGHRFSDDEVLFRFQFRMLSAIIAIVIFFALLFASMHFLGLNDIGTIHASVNLIYALSSSSQ